MVYQAERAQQPNTIHEGEYWQRCPHCGDSDNLHKAHYSVRMRDGVYFCLRCATSGRLSKGKLYELIGNLPITVHSDYMLQDGEKERKQKLEPFRIINQLETGPAIDRESLLNRYHYRDDNDRLWDAFLSWDIIYPDEPIGVLLRRSGKSKASYMYGVRGFAWAQYYLDAPVTPVSSMVKPLRLVEGPYDVVDKQDVCTFGIPSIPMMSDFYGQTIILCPDGDVWEKKDLRKGFFKLLKFLLRSPARRKPYLIGVEYLEDGLDPDEVPVEERNMITRKYLFDLIATKKGK